MPNDEEICVNINECLENPCVNGECFDRRDGFECHCFAGYTGTYCSAKEEAYRAYVSHGFIIAIIICVLVVLCKYHAELGHAKAGLKIFFFLLSNEGLTSCNVTMTKMLRPDFW